MTPATLRSNSISAWFLHNPTAANLLMVVFVLSGIVAIFTMRQEVFPNAVLDTIEIRTEYRGATATEVEAQVVRPMEQSINTLRDIRTVVSEIQSGGANIFVMLEERADAQRTIDEIRSVILRARETLRIWTGISSIVKAVACNLDPVIRFLMNLTAERRKRTSEKQQNL